MPPCFSSRPERRHTLRRAAPKTTLAVGKSLKKKGEREVFLHGEGCRAPEEGRWPADRPASPPPQPATGLLVQQRWHLPHVYRTTLDQWDRESRRSAFKTLFGVPGRGSRGSCAEQSAHQPDSPLDYTSAPAYTLAGERHSRVNPVVPRVLHPQQKSTAKVSNGNFKDLWKIIASRMINN